MAIRKFSISSVKSENKLINLWDKTTPDIDAEALVIAGGGGGGFDGGGGGGAGGLVYTSRVGFFHGVTYTVTVGSGGAGGSAVLHEPRVPAISIDLGSNGCACA